MKLIPMTPISREQRRRVQKLLDDAESALRLACEERLNLDQDTRRHICAAVDCILAAYGSLAEQPTAFAPSTIGRQL